MREGTQKQNWNEHRRRESVSSSQPVHDPAIIMDGVCKSFGEGKSLVHILQDVHGTVPHGAVLTIIGPSGSGKSTLLSLCNHLLTPDAGEVYVLGREIRQWTPSELRQRVGLVFQMPVMFPGTVQDNLLYGPNLRGQSVPNISNFLRDVGLDTKLLDRDASDLSGGQKQRVALARALVNDPDILLLDEVTSALDVSSVKDVEDVIVHRNRTHGTTVLWVTHSLEQAERVGTHTWFVADGRVMESGQTGELFHRPVQEQTARFLRGAWGERTETP